MQRKDLAVWIVVGFLSLFTLTIGWEVHASNKWNKKIEREIEYEFERAIVRRNIRTGRTGNLGMDKDGFARELRAELYAGDNPYSFFR